MQYPQIVTCAAALLFAACTPPKLDDSQTPTAIDTTIETGVSHTYIAQIGSRNAIVILKWGNYGDVAGQYTYPDDEPATIYQLKGKNTTVGELLLTEYTSGRQTGVVSLRKSASSSLIQWKGSIHPSANSIPLPITLTRQAN